MQAEIKPEHKVFRERKNRGFSLWQKLRTSGVAGRGEGCSICLLAVSTVEYTVCSRWLCLVDLLEKTRAEVFGMEFLSFSKCKTVKKLRIQNGEYPE